MRCSHVACCGSSRAPPSSFIGSPRRTPAFFPQSPRQVVHAISAQYRHAWLNNSDSDISKTSSILQRVSVGGKVFGRMRLIAGFLGILSVAWPALAGDVALEAGLARVEITPGTSMTMYGYEKRTCGPSQ